MQENCVEIRELNSDELIEIDAGKTIFYYLGFGFGYFAHAYTDNWASMTEGMGTNMRR